MIRFENVSKTVGSGRGSVEILDGVDDIFPTKGCTAIVGSQGTGKSTILNMISGTDFPTTGKIKSDQDISWVGNQVRLENKMTVRQNIRFFGRLAGCADLERLEDEIRTIIDLGAKYNQAADNLTGAERKAISLITSLTIDFDLYLFDGFPVLKGLADEVKLVELFDRRRRESGIYFCGNRNDLSNNCDSVLLIHDKQLEYYSDVTTATEKFDRIMQGQLQTGQRA